MHEGLHFAHIAVSHPVWVRGLKHLTAWQGRPAVVSHPVWVRGLKLIAHLGDVVLCVSHPVWVRGLKHGDGKYIVVYQRSHPVWVRGLKRQVHKPTKTNYYVAPRVGAWIETSKMADLFGERLCRTPCGCVD